MAEVKMGHNQQDGTFYSKLDPSFRNVCTIHNSVMRNRYQLVTSKCNGVELCKVAFVQHVNL